MKIYQFKAPFKEKPPRRASPDAACLAKPTPAPASLWTQAAFHGQHWGEPGWEQSLLAGWQHIKMDFSSSSRDLAQFGALPSLPLHGNCASSQNPTWSLKASRRSRTEPIPQLLGTVLLKAVLEFRVSLKLQAHPKWCFQPPGRRCAPPFLLWPGTGTLWLLHSRQEIPFAHWGCQWMGFLCLPGITAAFRQLWGHSSCPHPQYRMPLTRESVLAALWCLGLKSSTNSSLHLPCLPKARHPKVP